MFIKQLFITIFSILFTIIKSFTSSMLVLTVPHLCNVLSCNHCIYVCQILDMLTFSDPIKIILIVLNTGTFAALLMILIVELPRDCWSVKYLAYDETNLETNIEKYRKNKNYEYIFTAMDYWNTRLLTIYTRGLIVYLLNMILSSIYLVYYMFDYKTILSLLFFNICGSEMMYNGYIIANKSCKNKMIYSKLLNKNMSFNKIDSDFCDNDENTSMDYNIIERFQNKKINYIV